MRLKDVAEAADNPASGHIQTLWGTLATRQSVDCGAVFSCGGRSMKRRHRISPPFYLIIYRLNAEKPRNSPSVRQLNLPCWQAFIGPGTPLFQNG
jgi:hypothetical protein